MELRVLKYFLMIAREENDGMYVAPEDRVHIW